MAKQPAKKAAPAKLTDAQLIEQLIELPPIRAAAVVLAVAAAHPPTVAARIVIPALGCVRSHRATPPAFVPQAE